MTKPEKQQAFMESTSTMPEKNLWRSVVAQAVRDAFSKNEFHRWRAWVWFFHDSRDYCRVCEFAGVDADCLRQTMLETVFFNHLIQKGGITMSDVTKVQSEIELTDPSFTKPTTSVSKKFTIARRAKAIFSAIYTQQELDKAIGSLTLRDIIDICQQSEDQLDAEAALEADND
ncbi:MAG: hypothetical protein LBS14_04015 [Holosporaceae bacterium]|jgi:hypothetical protein|nr:hypothetical protein [Holosporaceae bacterium]